MANKMTYVQAIDVALDCVTDEVARERLEALKASLNKRYSSERKPTKKQVENGSIKGKIAEVLANGEQFTATAIGQAVGISNQKASALLKQMIENDHAVEKFNDGKVTYFRKVTE